MTKRTRLVNLLRTGAFVFGVLFAPQYLRADAPEKAAPKVVSAWPAKLFAPYAFMAFEDVTSDYLKETGHKYFTLAFITGDPDGQPAWDGSKEMRVTDGFYSAAIQTIRAKGGDVIVSFGGEDGQEMALTVMDPARLAEKYQSVVDRYHLTWLDFDIEGKTLLNQPANQRRNTALQKLQKNNPGLRITFTLPCFPTGLEPESIQLLTDAKKQGVEMASVNAMTMDYAKEVAAGGKMGELAITALKAAHEQLLTMGSKSKLGVTPMIGVNDVKSVVFTLDDARTLINFARQAEWVNSVALWSINRDQAKEGNDDNGIRQKKWDFTNLFESFAR